MNPIRVLPWVRVVKIGGQSIIDRGCEAIRPILNEIVQYRDEDDGAVLICCGGGTRARSIYSLASGLDLNGLCSVCREPLTEKEKALEGVGGSHVRCDECVRSISRHGGPDA